MSKWTKYLAILILAATIGLLVPNRIFAQSGATTASITGAIIDEQGANIPAATITIKNLQTNFMREVHTNEEGTYSAIQLPPGTYEINVSAPGFTSQTKRLDLVLGNTALYNFNMSVGAASEVIEVQANPSVDPSKTESSDNIDGQRIAGLPINRRNFLDFSLTTPRATIDRTPQQGITVSSGLSFNGQSARFNNVTVDGLDNNEGVSGAVRANFSQDAVQEFQVVSDSYSAEFGRATGGIVNIVTRGGGNELHGSLFSLTRNEALAARDAFANIKPEFKQYQFGALLSGPIKKDRAFFFASFERLSVKQNNIVTITKDTVASINRIGLEGRNGPIPFAVDNSSLLLRADARLNNNDTFWVRYNYSGAYNGAMEPFGGLVAESNGGLQIARENSIAFNNTYIDAGLNLVNETRFLYAARTLDIRNLGKDPQVQIFAPEGRVILGRSSFLPQVRDLKTIQFVDNVSLSRGRQQIKTGIDFKFNRFVAPLSFFGSGLSVFAPLDLSALVGTPLVLSGLQTFDPSLRTPAQNAAIKTLSMVLPTIAPGFPANLPLQNLSFPSFISQGFSDLAENTIEGKFIAGYLQDDIKIKPNFLFKIGVRYDLDLIDFMPSNKGNFAPRVSFAYQPKRLPNLRVHGSYGIFFGTPIFAIPYTLQLLDRNQIKILVVPFPFSILPFSLPGHGFPESAQIPASATFIPQLSQTLVYDRNAKNSYTQQTNFTLDYSLNTNTVLSLSYDYVRGEKFLTTRNINPVVRPVPGNAVAGAITGRVDTTRGDVFEFESAFDSYYHAFTIALNRRFSNHFNVLAHYTFAKAIDDFSDFRVDVNQPFDTLRPVLERSLSLQDVRNRFVISGLLDLGFGKSKILKGFQLSTIANVESGRPYNITAGADLNQNGDFPPSDRPLGLGRNAGVTPGFVNVDVRLQRTFNIKERYRIEGFAEAFNLFNRVNISEVDGTFPADAQGNFNLPKQENGRYIAPASHFRNAFAPRQFQLGLRLSF